MAARIIKPFVAVAIALAPLAAGIGGCNAIFGFDEAKQDLSLANDSSTDDGSAQSDGGPDPQETPCDRYCAIVMKNCVGVNQEYVSDQVCHDMCNKFELGAPSDESNDSLACRTYHGNSAALNPTYHCRHAGPTGAGHCGTNPCNAYCALDFELCAPLNLFPYDGGESGCRTACAAYPYIVSDDAGDLVFTTGDTLNCRIYHLESAYDRTSPNAATTHCPHTGVVSATCN